MSFTRFWYEPLSWWDIKLFTAPAWDIFPIVEGEDYIFFTANDQGCWEGNSAGSVLHSTPFWLWLRSASASLWWWGTTAAPTWRGGRPGAACECAKIRCNSSKNKHWHFQKGPESFLSKQLNTGVAVEWVASTQPLETQSDIDMQKTQKI